MQLEKSSNILESTVFALYGIGIASGVLILSVLFITQVLYILYDSFRSRDSRNFIYSIIPLSVSLIIITIGYYLFENSYFKLGYLFLSLSLPYLFVAIILYNVSAKIKEDR